MSVFRVAIAVLLMNAAVFAQKLPVAEKIATPALRTLVGYTRRVLHLHDGHTLAVLSYSGSAPANWLFLIDSRDLSSRRFAIPNNDIGSHSAALGSDGNIYLMPYQTGRAYRFDVASEKFSPIAMTGLPAGEFTWDACGGRDGCIYFGTYPNACVGRYEIATGKCTIWPHVVANTTYVFPVQPDDVGGGAFVRAFGAQTVWMKVDAKHAPTRGGAPVADALRPATQPAPPAGNQSLANTIIVGNATYGVGFPDGKLYELSPHRREIDDSQAPAEPWMLESVGDAIVGISSYGALFRYDTKTANFTRGKLDNLAAGGNHIMFLEAVAPDCVIGGSYSQQNLFCVNPASGEVKSSQQMIARTPGEASCAVTVGGRAYVGVYIRALVVKFDPREPFAFGKNPREIGEMFDEHHQTRPIGAASDGKYVFISSESDYGRPPGGALAVVDAATEKMDVYENVIEGQNLETIAYDPASKLVWGGTDRWGEMRSTPPIAQSAVVYAFDPATRKVVATLTAWKSADAIHVLGCPRDGMMAASNGGDVVTIDTATRKVSPLKLPTSPPGVIRRGADGDAYFVADGRMYRWRVKEGEFSAVAKAPGCTMLSEASPGVWVAADATSVYRVRVK